MPRNVGAKVTVPANMRVIPTTPRKPLRISALACKSWHPGRGYTSRAGLPTIQPRVMPSLYANTRVAFLTRMR